jgi:hypothetical protein
MQLGRRGRAPLPRCSCALITHAPRASAARRPAPATRSGRPPLSPPSRPGSTPRGGGKTRRRWRTRQPPQHAPPPQTGRPATPAGQEGRGSFQKKAGLAVPPAAKLAKPPPTRLRGTLAYIPSCFNLRHHYSLPSYEQGSSALFPRSPLRCPRTGKGWWRWSWAAPARIPQLARRWAQSTPHGPAPA